MYVDALVAVVGAAGAGGKIVVRVVVVFVQRTSTTSTAVFKCTAVVRSTTEHVSYIRCRKLNAIYSSHRPSCSQASKPFTPR